jgi:hypothetical protein
MAVSYSDERLVNAVIVHVISSHRLSDKSGVGRRGKAYSAKVVQLEDDRFFVDS